MQTNWILVQANLIYLGYLTGRVPIVNRFRPTHNVHPQAPRLLFSDVFDLDYLSEKVGIPILEWTDVKDPSSREVEEVGCWSVWQAVQQHDPNPRPTYTEEDQGLGMILPHSAYYVT
jgi:hypothetical protein